MRINKENKSEYNNDHAHSHLPSDPELRVKAIETLPVSYTHLTLPTIDPV